MDEGFLLQSVEALGDSPFVGTGGEIWEWLQGEKEEVSQDLLAEGSLCHGEAGGLREHEASETSVREIEWRHRGPTAASRSTAVAWSPIRQSHSALSVRVSPTANKRFALCKLGAQRREQLVTG